MNKSLVDGIAGQDAPPPPPGSDAFGMVTRLRTPQRRRIGVALHQPDSQAAADLSKGIHYRGGFPDPQGLLRTAEQSLLAMLEHDGLHRPDGIAIVTRAVQGLDEEAFRLAIQPHAIELSATAVKGIRRGLYELQHRLMGADGPWLMTGTSEHRPWLKHRISRCFHGPIKRPPLNRDELLDDVDYYPDALLDRLASEGVNGLWLTIAFADLCKTSMTPLAPQGERRLAKLRRTVAKCARYGINIWPFCIEPRGFMPDDPMLKRHPQWRGAERWQDICFCPSSDSARQYLYESTQWLFSQVPGLGGLINISHGERATTCLSCVDSTIDRPIHCPRCGSLPKWQVLNHALTAMRDGINVSAPDARLISWLYMPHPTDCAPWVFDVVRHTPAGVIVQCNFESGVKAMQLGRQRIGGDYWLSCAAPADDFIRCAQAAAESDGQLSAKIQVSVSHEVATVPHVPVPGLLYRKYKAMRGLGCEHVMQCWYFGSHPGLMNRVAGALACEPWIDSERAFLLRQARMDWGEDAPAVVRAWEAFADAYGHYPLATAFQRYGPMHDGPVWPLHLMPAMQPLFQTWQSQHPPSGDAIGECLGAFSLDEAVALCGKMVAGWNQGLAHLQPLREKGHLSEDRLAEIGVAEALGIQFASGLNILRFYQQRARLFHDAAASSQASLETMRRIVLDEIAHSQRLTTLCEADPSLGFHSEAESYKYFPDKLRWRIRQLQALLADDFPRVERMRQGEQPWASCMPDGPAYRVGQGWVETPSFRWRAQWDDDGLTIHAQGHDSRLRDTVFFAYVANELVTHAPWLMRCQFEDPYHHQAHVACSFERPEPGRWTATARLSRAAWADDPSHRPCYISLLCNSIGHDGQSQRTFWPAREEARSRLDLAYWHPRQVARLT